MIGVDNDDPPLPPADVVTVEDAALLDQDGLGLGPVQEGEDAEAADASKVKPPTMAA